MIINFLKPVYSRYFMGIFLKSPNRLSFFKNLFIISAATASFDIFLVLNIGFNFRITQLFLLLASVPVLYRIALLKPFQVPIGFNYLLIFFALIVLFTFNTNFLIRNIGYTMWLAFNILTIITCINLFKKRSDIFILFNAYINIFVLISIFGISQFIFGVLLGSGKEGFLLITQWWTPQIPRINGFSYEPSFYSTYLLMGWVILAYLLESNSSSFNRSYIVFKFLIVSTALILSSSRMGIFMMSLWFVRYPFFVIFGAHSKVLNNYSKNVTLKICLLFLITAGLILYFVDINNLLFLFSGVGLFDSSSHSIDIRMNQMIDTLSLIRENPLVGVGLGGIGPAIAEYYGIKNPDFETVKQFEGLSVFIEVLAGAGVIGFICLIIFFGNIFFASIITAKKISIDEAHVLRALSYALLFELIILQFNQVILRPYLWVHIAILCSLILAFRR